MQQDTQILHQLLTASTLAQLEKGEAGAELQAAAAQLIGKLRSVLREQAANQEKMRQALVSIWHGEDADPSVTALDALVDAKAIEAGTARAWAAAESRELTLVVQMKGAQRSNLIPQLDSLKGDLEAGFVGGHSTSGDGAYRYAVRDTGSMIDILTKQAA